MKTERENLSEGKFNESEDLQNQLIDSVISLIKDLKILVDSKEKAENSDFKPMRSREYSRYRLKPVKIEFSKEYIEARRLEELALKKVSSLIENCQDSRLCQILKNGQFLWSELIKDLRMWLLKFDEENLGWSTKDLIITKEELLRLQKVLTKICKAPRDNADRYFLEEIKKVNLESEFSAEISLIDSSGKQEIFSNLKGHRRHFFEYLKSRDFTTVNDF